MSISGFRKSLELVLLSAALAVAGGAHAADELSDCYKKAQSRSDVGSCLKKEYAQVQSEYNDVLDRVNAVARGVDRQSRSKNAANAFLSANKRFDEYLKAECRWVEESYGTAPGSANGELACRINLTRIRTGALERQFLNGDKSQPAN